MNTLTLLADNGVLHKVALNQAGEGVAPGTVLKSRVAYAAAHIVPRTLGNNTPGAPADIDWDATLGIRRRIYAQGLGVADAMDTAQRNLGLDFAGTKELIRRSAEVARECRGKLVVGVNTDHLEASHVSLQEVIDAYKLQLDIAEEAGADAVLMASRHLAAAASDAKAYRSAYDAILKSTSRPVVLHWLGTAFDPALAGYFGSSEWQLAADTVLHIIQENREHVVGIKMSLLDWRSEVYLRERLPDGVRMFTGDDYNYVRLIGGAEVYGSDSSAGGFDDARGHSDALLGAFASFPKAAAAAIQALDRGDAQSYRRILEPTEALSRHIFATPTYFYKTGVAFMAWLNGYQTAFQMVGGLHSARSLPHLSRIVELANDAQVFECPELAAERWYGLLKLNGLK
ncbi:dihydrodipicolinate synthase family protein [Halomonas dongshanensis]|uniref:Dihydrodipicolinate synthase family protein n=1 Tax=Halomonas dongshanensis TaxID=2890835 RepID=A0ABT2EBK5_9GAMM|nr:dihydrodipicolinate synthase family protein [Halomonas dongshanensis]MCS2608733.1 dihydrodipicolinate synthase family protein [Halomonas dongshanensis]